MSGQPASTDFPVEELPPHAIVYRLARKAGWLSQDAPRRFLRVAFERTDVEEGISVIVGPEMPIGHSAVSFCSDGTALRDCA